MQLRNITSHGLKSEIIVKSEVITALNIKMTVTAYSVVEFTTFLVP